MSIDAKKVLNKMRGGRPIKFGQMLAFLGHCDEVSQVWLAKKIDVYPGLICDIEKGRRNATVKQAAKIAKAMRYSEAVLVKYALDDQSCNARLKLQAKLEAA